MRADLLEYTVKSVS